MTYSRNRFQRLLYQQPALAVTVIYLLLSAIGMMFEFGLFREFGINILDYAQASDFLLAALRKPVVILVSLAPLPLLWVIVRVGNWSHQFSPRWAAMNARIDTPAAKRVVYPLFVIFYFGYFTLLYAEYEADRIRTGVRKVVRVELVAPAAEMPRIVRGNMVGTTGQYLFLYLPGEQAVRIVPVSNTSQLIIQNR